MVDMIQKNTMFCPGSLILVRPNAVSAEKNIIGIALHEISVVFNKKRKGGGFVCSADSAGQFQLKGFGHSENLPVSTDCSVEKPPTRFDHKGIRKNRRNRIATI